MKKILKKAIPMIVMVCILLSMVTLSVHAEGSSIAFSKSKIAIGETLTVTVRFSTASADPMYGLEGFIIYDPAVLEYASGSGGNLNLLTPGKIKIVLQSAGKTNLSEQIKFKAIKSGSSVISAESLVYVNSSESEQPLKGSSATVTVTDPSVQASSNANLKGLTVSSGTLSPNFSPDVTEYSVTIENSVTELYVSVSKADPSATYTVKGSKDMKVGVNQRAITLTAENGNTKTYTITITRLDESGNVPSEENDTPVNQAIEVTVNGDIYYVQDDFSTENLPLGFNVIDYAFNGQTVPAISDGVYNIVLLSQPDGSVSNFYAVLGDNKFEEIIFVELGGSVYTILPAKEIPTGYSLVNDCQINEVSVPAYKNTSASSDFFLVYAKGPGGQNAFYNYDALDNTLQRALNLTFGEKEDEDNQVNEEITYASVISAFMELGLSAKIVVVTIIAIILLLVAAIIVLIVKIATAGRPEKIDSKENEEVDFEYISIGEPISGESDVEESAEEEIAEELFEEEEESDEENNQDTEEEETEE